MPRNSFTSSSDGTVAHKLPLGLIGAIVLTLLTHVWILNSESFWRFFQLRAVAARDDNVRLEADFRLMPPAEADPARVFLVGSSQTREGIDVGMLNERLGGGGVKLYNLGISGAQGLDMLMLAPRLIEHRPAAMVWVPSIHTFYFSYDTSKIKMVFDPVLTPGWVRHHELARLWRERDTLIEAYLGLAFPIYRYRDQMARISLAWMQQVAFHGPQPLEPQSLYKFKPGQMRDERYFARYGKVKDMFKSDEWTQWHQESFLDFARLVSEAGIRLIVIDAPIHPMTRNTYDHQRIDKELHDLLRENAERIGYSYYSADQLPPFEEAEYADFLHLNVNGRNRLTGIIADILEREGFGSPKGESNQDPAAKLVTRQTGS